MQQLGSYIQLSSIVIPPVLALPIPIAIIVWKVIKFSEASYLWRLGIREETSYGWQKGSFIDPQLNNSQRLL